MSDAGSEQYATPSRLAARQALHARYANTDWFSWVAERLALQPGERVIDVGCGSGSFWRASQPHLPPGLALTLTDLSPGMVEAAQSLRLDDGDEIACVQANAAALPFPDGQFDTALAMHMLYHVDEPIRALQEMRRVLRPGGRCCVATNGAGNMAELRALAERSFGTTDGDWGGAQCQLDDAETMMRDVFTDVVRHDLRDVMLVTDPRDLVAYLLSTPQADRAGSAARGAVEKTVDAAMRAGDGTVRITKRLGMVVGRAR